MSVAAPEVVDELIAELRKWENFESVYAPRLITIVDKEKQRVHLYLNKAQAALLRKLIAQRLAGKPMRAIVLKARQVGISTLIQALLIWRSTLSENHEAIVVAHDIKTGDKLFKMGQTMYSFLPEDEELPVKPPIKYHKRGRLLHFAEPSSEAWQHGQIGLDSRYEVDTAGERESGRGGTYHSVHASEVAFWDDIGTKLDALLSGVPKSIDSLVVLESTANGLNEFKDRWDDAMEGRSTYIPFFWPWWKQDEYTLPFANAAERKDFERELGDEQFGGKEETALLDPGPIDIDTGEHVPLTLEQLHWRRQTISDELGGRRDKFKQEYPATPDEAFLFTGRRVFDPFVVQKVMLEAEITDPRVPSPERQGPRKGRFRAGSSHVKKARVGTIDVPDEPLWIPRAELEVAESANWKLWLTDEDFKTTDDRGNETVHDTPQGDYVIACDVSGGKLNDTDEPDWHAIQVIDHRTREQVGMYHSRVDPDLLATELYLAALYFNMAWVAIEVTGGWGVAPANRLWKDYQYPYIYFKHSVGQKQERQEKRIGWDTNVQTKPIMVSNLGQMLREGTHGIRCRETAGEAQTYVRDERGRTGAESGKYDDLIECYMIVQAVANEMQIKLRKGGGKKRGKPSRSRDPQKAVTGY